MRNMPNVSVDFMLVELPVTLKANQSLSIGNLCLLIDPKILPCLLKKKIYIYIYIY